MVCDVTRHPFLICSCAFQRLQLVGPPHSMASRPGGERRIMLAKFTLRTLVQVSETFSFSEPYAS